MKNRKEKEKEIELLMKEQKFLDIYNKYGLGEYRKRIHRIINYDTYNETGNNKLAIYEQIKSSYNQLLTDFLKISIAFTSFMLTCFFVEPDLIIYENEIKYEKEIDDYNDHIKAYAEKIKKLGLNDFEVIMKVIYDEWNYIEGYGPANFDEMGFYRLAFTEPNQSGVCRNIADDVTAKLNMINPEYEAQNLIVYAENNEWTFSDIKVHYASNYKKSNGQGNEFMERAIGNHLITVVKLPGTDTFLTIDSTNPSIGVLKNGKIYTFSTPDGKGLLSPLMGNVLYGVDHLIDTDIRNLESFLSNDESIEQLKEKYGIESQNKVLEKIKSL